MRIGLLGTVPFEGYKDYDTFISKMRYRFGDGVVKAYENKEDYYILPNGAYVIINKETILPRIYKNIKNAQFEFILKYDKYMPQAFGAKRLDPTSIIHDVDLEKEIPNLKPYDLLYIDYETIPYIQRFNNDLEILLRELSPLVKKDGLIIIDEPSIGKQFTYPELLNNAEKEFLNSTRWYHKKKTLYFRV